MTRFGSSSALLFTGLLLTASVELAQAYSPYDTIAARNVFALRPEQRKVVEQKPEPLPTVVLTGITTILKTKHALLSVQTPNQPTEFCTLSEGQSQNGVQILHIDEVSGTVELKNRGTIQTLDFKNNGAKSTGAVAVAAMPRTPVPRLHTLPPPPMPTP